MMSNFGVHFDVVQFLQKRMMDKTGLNLTADGAGGRVNSIGIISASIRGGKLFG